MLPESATPPGDRRHGPRTHHAPPASYSLAGNQTHQRLEFSAFYSHFQEASSQMTSLPGQCGHVVMDVLSCKVTNSCELQPCGKSTAPKTRVFNLQLTGNFRSNDVTFGSLPVTWSHVTSFPVTGLLHPCKKSNAPNSQVFRPSTATSRQLPVNWLHIRVTSGHVRSRDVISCHVTASSCELQPCRKSNTPNTQAFGLVLPLPGDFRWDDITSVHVRSLDLICCREWLFLRAKAL